MEAAVGVSLESLVDLGHGTVELAASGAGRDAMVLGVRWRWHSEALSLFDGATAGLMTLAASVTAGWSHVDVGAVSPLTVLNARAEPKAWKISRLSFARQEDVHAAIVCACLPMPGFARRQDRELDVFEVCRRLGAGAQSVILPMSLDLAARGVPPGDGTRLP
jgi:hypothetical protein